MASAAMNQRFPMEAFPLETPRLRLRRFTLDDADDVWEYTSDPEVTRYLILETHRTRQESRELLKKAIEAYECAESLMFAVEYKPERKVVGGCAMRNWERASGRVEIAFALARRYWQQGIMTEALNALLDSAFRRMDLNRIEAHTMPANAASRRLLEKLGFRCEGIMRQHEYFKGAYQDLALYSLLASDWPRV
jgi:[ribosomal protein S5]-alanine N-acetyltransferase